MSAASSDDIDIVVLWLIKVAENTARVRDAVEGKGTGAGGSTASAASKEDREEARFGQFARRVEGAIAGGLAGKLAQAQGLANRGMGGTVEQARHDYAMDQLGRQFAAVMMPVMQGMTYFAEQLANRMRGMNGSEQNRLMGGIVGAGIGMRYGGLPGALAGSMAGGLMAGGHGEHDGMMGMVAGAYAGYRVGRLAGPTGAVAGTVVGAGVGYVAGEGDYGRLRAGGNNKFWSGAGSGLAALGDFMHFTTLRHVTPDSGVPMGEDMRRRMSIADTGALGRTATGVMHRGMDALGIPRTRDAAEGRRDVTPFSAEMSDAGSLAMKLQEGVIRATAGEGREDGGPFKEFADAVLWVLGQILAAVTGSAAPRPMGASGSVG